MSEPLIAVLDFETTGLAPPQAAVCEVGICEVVQQNGRWMKGAQRSWLVNPGRPIPPEASAVHHITDADVRDAPSWEQVVEFLRYDPAVIFAAHNAKFEKQFFNPEGSRWLCTYKLGLWCWPECPSHSNQCLRYWLGLNLADPAAAVPHRAPGDAYVTAAILREVLTRFAEPIDRLVEQSALPAMLPRMRFGKKWYCKPFEEVDTGYLQWMIDQPDMDEDAKYTAQHHLKLRRQRKGAPKTAEQPYP